MARDGSSSWNRKSQGWTSTSHCEKSLFGGYHSWFNMTVAICCICASIYVLQLAITKGQNYKDLKDLSSVLNGLPLVPSSPPPLLFNPEDSASPPPRKKPGSLLLPPPRQDQEEETVKFPSRGSTDITRIVFGIGAAAKSWNHRKEYIKLWWKLNKGGRGFVWLDTPVADLELETDLPTLRVSAETSNFRSEGSKAGVRLSRIVSEMFRLGLPDVDWFVMGDDDTFYFPDNLVKVLSKYDHRLMFYVGSHSESHFQNLLYSYNMAFGGGGFAISYPLAKELSSMLDDCLTRYPHAFGSDERMHACTSELGVSLTKEPGFHQMDIHGSPFGLLAAHPVNPLVSVHHLDAYSAIFPETGTREEAMAHLVEAAKVDQASLLQQSMCYHHTDHGQTWSLSVSWGYAVQVYKQYLTPRDLETPLRTFYSCRHKTDKTEFPFNTREPAQDLCEQPTVFYMSSVRKAVQINEFNELLECEYKKEKDERKQRLCDLELEPLNLVQRIRVTKEPVPDSWFQAPRRACCQVMDWNADTIELHLGACKPRIQP